MLHRYFLPGGRARGSPYKALPLYKQNVSVARQHVTILANFVEVWLAMEGHDNPVGINLLTKVQMPSQRVCDIGYLRTTYRDAVGGLGYRCSAEPVDAYVKKGGGVADTVDRRCLCNALHSNIGLPQVRDEGAELPLVTSGDDLVSLGTFLAGRTGYSAADVIAHLLAGTSATAA